MIRHGTAPFLECSSKGDKRFSAFYATLPSAENRSIEQIYQGAKVFMDGSTGLGWKAAKGRLCINQHEVRALYSQLWDEYIESRPELKQILIEASGLSDVFGQEGHACQATELWRIRERLIMEEIHRAEEGAALHSQRIIAVIGTAGRDKSKTMSAQLWQAMCRDLETRLRPEDHLVSGGAAWADHLAVHAYLQGWCKDLTLYLPAPLVANKFQGPLGDRRNAAHAANYYHNQFGSAVGIDSITQIVEAIEKGAQAHHEPITYGYGAMFARNKKVASHAHSVVAYTFGEGATPADGGTKNTWDQIKGDRTHVALDEFTQNSEVKTPSAPRRTFQFVRPK